MHATEFQLIRQKLLKTQKQMAELLGVSLKAVQSFEQGWRSIPSYVERQALFLLTLKIATLGRVASCFEIRRCPPRMREACPRGVEGQVGGHRGRGQDAGRHGRQSQSSGENETVTHEVAPFASGTNTRRGRRPPKPPHSTGGTRGARAPHTTPTSEYARA